LETVSGKGLEPPQVQTNKHCGSMRDIVLPRKEGCNDLAKSWRSEKDSVAARDRRIPEFPLSMTSKTVAKILKTEGWYSPKTTIYHIEFRVGASVKKSQCRNVRSEDQNRPALTLESPIMSGSLTRKTSGGPSRESR
jgi:hypothetical protein